MILQEDTKPSVSDQHKPLDPIPAEGDPLLPSSDQSSDEVAVIVVVDDDAASPRSSFEDLYRRGTTRPRALSTSSSLPPYYPPPVKARSRRARATLAGAVVLSLLAASALAVLARDEWYSGPDAPITRLPRPIVEHPQDPSTERGWDKTLYLPPLHHGTPQICSSAPTATFRLPISDLPLFLRFATVRRRPTRSSSPVHEGTEEAMLPEWPEADVLFIPWLETDNEEPWEEDNMLIRVSQQHQSQQRPRDYNDDNLACTHVGATARNKVIAILSSPPAEVCLMSSQSDVGLGVYSSSANPPRLKISVHVPTSTASARFPSNFLIDGLQGTFVADGLKLPEDDVLEKAWSRFEVRGREAAIQIKSFAAKELLVSSSDRPIVLGDIHVSKRLTVNAALAGTFDGEITFLDGASSSIRTASGALIANTSLVPIPAITSSSYSPSNEEAVPENEVHPSTFSSSQLSLDAAFPPVAAPAPLSYTITNQPPQARRSSSWWRTTASKVLPSALRNYRSIDVGFGSESGNVSVLVRRHYPHIPLHAKLESISGNVSVWLDPNYQGSLSLTSPYKITLDLPSKDESSIPDPLGLGRRYRAIIGALQGGRTVLGRCGFGWMGKPDLDGWIVMSSREGTVGIWRRRSHYITDAAERSAISPSSVAAEETAEDDDDGVGYSA